MFFEFESVPNGMRLYLHFLIFLGLVVLKLRSTLVWKLFFKISYTFGDIKV